MTVRNGGTAAVDNVEVQVWVCDYGVGIGPKGGVPSAGGANGLGPRVLGSIAAGGAVPTTLRWNVTQDDAIRNPDGHHCITVVHVRDGFGPTERDHLLSGGLVEWTHPARDPFCTRLVLAGEAEWDPDEQAVVRGARGRVRDLVLDGDLGGGSGEGADHGGGGGCGEEGDDVIDFFLRPDDIVPMRVRTVIPRKARRAEVFVFDVVQRDRKGSVLAGARMLAPLVR